MRDLPYASRSLQVNFHYLCRVFNIIATRTLNEYGKQYPEAKTALQKWYHEIAEANFKNFNELKQTYANASVVGDDRAVFHLCGNKYRLVVRCNFLFKSVQVKWFGTHKEYDKVNVEKIQFIKKRKS